MTVLLCVRGLKTTFDTSAGVVRAVNGLDFYISQGEIVGLVGETGSGKSVSGLSILRLILAPGRITDGRILLEGLNLLALSEREMSGIRGSKVSMIFQNPRESLNPLFRIGEQVERVVRLHSRVGRREARLRAVGLMEAVEIGDPVRVLGSYPHELSGGMCQRAMIAIALSGQPRLLIADEPTTGLDVTVQAQVVELIRERVRAAHMSCLFITHDLGVVAELCDRVLVMYAGRIVEEGSTSQVFARPAHPYTQGLLRSTLRVDRETPIVSLPGVVPDAVHLPPGCPFNPRCSFVANLCRTRDPERAEAEAAHWARCFLVSGEVGDDRTGGWVDGNGETVTSRS